MSELTAEEKQRKGLRGLFRFLKRRDSEAALREAIEEFIEESEPTDADQPSTGESSLLLNILKLGEKTAYDVMTPRVDIRAAPEDIDFRGLIQLVREHGHSRVPIFRNDLDDIVGIDGLVTIEDLVEEVIGEIEDEHDVVRGPSLVQRPDGTWLADARTKIEEFEERVGPVLTEEERAHDIDTLGGLVMSLTDRVPSRGELVTHASGIAFEVIDADPRRIKRLRVRNAKPIAPDERA